MTAVSTHRHPGTFDTPPMARALCALIAWMIVTALGMDGFAYDLKLMDVKTLAGQTDQWVILDARPRKVWQTAHLPGAVSFSWEDYTKTDIQKIPYRIWPADELAGALGQMGIDRQTPIVVYGDADTSWGGEGWDCWALVWLGHQGPIRLLAGGVQAWQRVGLAMEQTQDSPHRSQTVYQVQLRDEVTIATRQVATLEPNQILIDTRSTLEWLTGHLSGAVHLPWTSLYQGKDRHPIDAATYSRLLVKRNIKNTDELIFYCTGGVRSAYAWVVHTLYQPSPAKNYEGGTEAWDRLGAR